MRRSWVQIPSRPPDSAQRTQLSRTTIERGRKRAVTASQGSSISEFESFTCSDRLCLAKTYPDLGSTAHSRRTAQAGFRALGKECLAMDSASSESSRFREALADVPQKPSRGHCGNGFLHRPNAHVSVTTGSHQLSLAWTTAGLPRSAVHSLTGSLRSFGE